jgi:predicted amidophosphoribosyltransferase
VNLPAGKPLGFPNCQKCPYVINGPVHVCAACAAQTITHVPQQHCEICSQDTSTTGGRCTNQLCSTPDRAIESVFAIAMSTEPLRNLIRGFKDNPELARGLIFGRLVLGWLQANLPPTDVDLIVPNPTFTQAGALGHTEKVLANARGEDVFGEYPFPPLEGRVLVKTAATVKSKDSRLEQKMAAAAALEAVLSLRVDVTGKRVIVYDDVLTSGYQLNTIARFLKANGAASVRGLVLARAAWRPR